MTITSTDFREYLAEIHLDFYLEECNTTYPGQVDDVNEDFRAWLNEMDQHEWVYYADAYVRLISEATKIAAVEDVIFNGELNNVVTGDALTTLLRVGREVIDLPKEILKS